MASNSPDSSTPPRKPTRSELQAAYGKGVADVIAPGLKVLFCGINPGLYTAAIGHHFGRPGNRFWPALHAGGFTPRLLSPYEERLLLDWGWGITNLVNKATARADQLTRADLQEGGRLLVAKVAGFRPRCLAVLGIGAYRGAFGQPKAVLGRQDQDHRRRQPVGAAQSQRVKRPLPGRRAGHVVPRAAPGGRRRIQLISPTGSSNASPQTMPERFFAVTAPGIKPIAAQELLQLGFQPGQPERDSTPGGVEFNGELRDLYRANLHLRSVSRVLLRLGDFYAAAFSELRKKAGRLPWEHWINPGRPLALRVTCHKSRLYHSGAVAQRVAGAIGDRLGQAPPLESFDQSSGKPLPQLVLVRLERDLCTISLDSSGAGLHRRGYRLATAKAPLRETLAAAMLLASGWDGSASLWDPFCGSGAIPIEAACLAQNLGPRSLAPLCLHGLARL
jgi:double-stranded uracil-DNA glycosylase